MNDPGASVLNKKVLVLRLRTCLLLMLASPFLILIFLNLLFSTAFGTGLLERQIEKKLGLPCEIKKLNWSPWAGLRVWELELFGSRDSPLDARILRVGEIKLDPSWISLLKGEKRFEKLEVDELSGELSLEQFEEILKRHQRRHPVTVREPSPRKNTNKDLSDREGKDLLHPKIPAKPQRPRSDEGGQKTPQRESEDEGQAGSEAPGRIPDSGPVDDFEGRVIFKEVNLRLYSQADPNLEVNLRDCGATIPLWGQAREGELRLGSVAAGSCLSSLDALLPLRWNGDSLVMARNQLKILGIEIELEGEMKLSRGLPLGLRVNLPDQQMDLSPIFPDRSTPLEVRHLSSRNYFQAHLLNLRRFTGRSFTRFTELVLHDPKDGGDLKFDRGSVALTLNSGGLVVNDMRAIGEEDSILGNAYVTMTGEAAATVRIVSSPVRADSHEQRIKQASPSLTLQFRPLITPDREYRDIRVESRPEGLAANLGLEKKWVPLAPVVRAVLEKSKPPKQNLP